MSPSFINIISISARPKRSSWVSARHHLYVAIIIIFFIHLSPIELILTYSDASPVHLDFKVDKGLQERNPFYSSSLENNSQQPSTGPPPMPDSRSRVHQHDQPNQIQSNGSPSSSQIHQQSSTRTLGSVHNLGHAQPQGYDSPSSTYFNATIQINKNVPDLDSLSEGSGNGSPAVSKQHKEKFDDTEEGDDDDEDYDYKDSVESGSGHGNEHSGSKKVEILGNNQLKRPTANESNMYSPFRNPSTIGATLQTLPKVPQMIVSDPPINIMNNQLKTPNLPLSTPSPLPTTLKYSNFNVSSLSRPNTTSKDSDYLYEDENEDEDSEDSSIFDYNDSSENDTINKTLATNNATFTSTIALRPIQTTPRPIITVVHTSTTAAEPATPSTVQPTKSILNSTIKANSNSFNQRYPSSSFESPFTTTTTRSPVSASTSSTINHPDEDEEDEEEEEGEEEDEEIEEDIEDDGSNQDETLAMSNNPAGAQWHTRPSNWPATHQYLTPPPTTTNLDLNDGNRKPSKNVEPSIIAQPSSPAVPSRYFTPTLSRPLASSLPPIKPPITATVLITTTTTTTTRVPPTTTTTTTSDTTTMLPPTVAPTSASTTTMQTNTIKYITTPKSVVFPAITRTSDIAVFDRGSHDDDVGLTKQIYDKAYEIYGATSKAIHAAMEAVWVPAFELNSNALEPLVTQPLLFMLVLGAAIIGLVLTMMLIVYIITYQIQPKDDDISDIY